IVKFREKFRTALWPAVLNSCKYREQHQNEKVKKSRLRCKNRKIILLSDESGQKNVGFCKITAFTNKKICDSIN
ncbi:MAG: hypothetical protein LUI39_07025, partial [Lachnospiraceae bacterium]|nr:hypothetical protein [Lachnospiraceae bacterium]